MAALTFNKFNVFVEDLAEKQHNLAVDTLKVLLTNTAPAANNAITVDIAEVGSGNGYTAGGVALTVTSSAQTGGVYKLVVSNPSPWTATGGPIGPFRYMVLYNASNNRLIAFYDYGVAVTLNTGEQFQLTFDATNGVMTIQ